MLRIIQNSSAAGAASYYVHSDYYTEGQELTGVWRGQGAARLGLHGAIQQKDWQALCENCHPGTGLKLTARQKTDRTVGYDFNFHLPKSVSLVHALTDDGRILEAFRESVNETMEEVEQEMKTRVRQGGRNEDITTGNAVWGEYIHQTSRPVDGIPDAHLHAHCYCFNITFAKNEDRWKAGQFRDLKRDGPYFEARFHARMSRRMEELGLPVVRTAKGWEIDGISKSTLDLFSRRTAVIERAAKEQGIADPHEKDGLGARTREGKNKNLTMEQLRQEWRSRLGEDAQNEISKVVERIGTEPILENAQIAHAVAAWAVEHCFERKSVVPYRQLLAEAFKRGYGHVSVENIEHAVGEQGLIIANRGGREFATTASVLAEEKRVIDYARRGRGTCRKIGDGRYVFQRDWLNKDQRLAVAHILDSNDRVILIRGAAGVGKTSMMLEAVEAIEARGKKVFTFAPSANASRGVLREEGFATADTVAALLNNETMQKKLAHQVLWIDEAGMVGTKTMRKIFDLAERMDARVILSGDVKQHGSVERGAALRLLETEAGLIPAQIKDIQRQRDHYKQAIKALSEGRTEDGFDQLDKLGWIREIADADRYKVLADDYLAAISKRESALVVSPTHAEGRSIAERIRAGMKEKGLLGKDERIFPVLEKKNLTVAERRDRINYNAGEVVVFNQNAVGYRKGRRLVVGQDKLPLDQAEKLEPFRVGTLQIAPGDILRVTQNGRTADGEHRLNNGGLYVVKGFRKNGDITLTNGWTVSKDFGFLTHGVCVTSFASQSKSVDRVFIGQSAESFPASSQEQWYVSNSRGRKQTTIYTSDKAALREAVCQSDDRLTATEMVSQDRYQRATAIQRIARLTELKPDPRQANREREGVAYERQ